MARVTPIAEALQGENGQRLAAIKGKLVNLWEPETKEGKYGSYTAQNGALDDGTGKIRVCFKDRDAIPQNWRNQLIWVQAGLDKKNKMAGIEIFVYERDGEEQRTIYISKQADIVKGDAVTQPGGKGGPGRSSTPGPQGQLPLVNSPEQTRDGMHRLSALYAASIKAAAHAISLNEKELTELQVDPTTMLQGVATSIFIEATKPFRQYELGLPRAPKPKPAPRKEPASEPGDTQPKEEPDNGPQSDVEPPEDWGENAEGGGQ